MSWQNQNEMKTKSTFIVGATDDADIVIKQATVSKRHCELRWTENGWLLRDLDSTNGTFVDGERLTEDCRVTKDQRITLGRGVVLELPSPPEVKPSVIPQIEEFAEITSKNKQAKLEPATYLLVSVLVLCFILVGLLGVYFGSGIGKGKV